MNIFDRFYAFAHKTEGCWLWTGKTRRGDYARYDFYAWGKRIQAVASRLSWVIHNGPIPKGLMVCHTCDTPLCVRPSHLFLGTAQDNKLDSVRKGRSSTGELNGRAVLDASTVKQIRQELAAGVSGVTLAARYKVQPGCISKIATRRSWRHV